MVQNPLPAPINKDLPCGGFWFIDSQVRKRTRKGGFDYKRKASRSAPVRQSRMSAVNKVSPLPAPINKDLPCGGFWFIDSQVRKRTRKGGFDYKRKASRSAPVRQSRMSAVNKVSPLPAPIKNAPLWRFFYWKLCKRKTNTQTSDLTNLITG